MRSKFAFLFTLSLLLSGLLQAATNHLETIASYTYPVHNLNTGLSYTTIQEAIDAYETLNGHTIRVDAGTYYEHITITKSITLIGEGRDVAIIDGNGTGTVMAIVAVNYVNLSDFTIRNAGPNWGVGHFDACIECEYVQNVVLENNVIMNAGRCIVIGYASLIEVNNNSIFNGVGYGMDVGTSHNVTISNNFIHDNGEFGINIDGNSNYCTIINNTVENGSVGIDLAPNVHNLLVPLNNLIDGNIVSNNSEVNLLVMGARGRSQECYTNVFRRNNLTNAQHHNLIVWGFNLASFVQDIDSSNTADNKRIYYLTNSASLEIDPASYPDAGYLALVNCTDSTVRDLDFASNKDGLLLAGSTNCTLANVTLGNNRLYFCPYAGTNGSYPSYWGGLTFFESFNNTIENCRIFNNSCGVGLCRSDWNLFYHNSFIGNDRNVISDYYYPFQDISSGYFSTNIWDDGLEGNHWSEYDGMDANEDGIGDTPYFIDSNNTDLCPLMGRFHGFAITWQEKTYPVNVISNSTVSDQIGYVILSWINLSTQSVDRTSFEEIFFYVSGEDGTHGFCRVYIPAALFNGTYRVFVNGTEVPSTLLPGSNSTGSYLYFTYAHSKERVQIIPEFSSLLVLHPLMMATLLAVVMCRRKSARAERKPISN
jgi:parallel beta-helix repeat protein